MNLEGATPWWHLLAHIPGRVSGCSFIIFPVLPTSFLPELRQPQETNIHIFASSPWDVKRQALLIGQIRACDCHWANYHDQQGTEGSLSDCLSCPSIIGVGKRGFILPRHGNVFRMGRGHRSSCHTTETKQMTFVVLEKKLNMCQKHENQEGGFPGFCPL